MAARLMKPSLMPLHAQARTMLSEYLAKHPDEREATAQVARQIERNDPDLLARSNMAGHITASGVVLNADLTKILLIHHAGLDRWLQPGGHVDAADPSIWGAAAREVLEETGVAVRNPILFDIDSHTIPANERKNEGAHTHHDFAFLVFAESEALSPQLSEVHAARWITLDELTCMEGQRMQRLARKLRPMMS